MPKFKIKIQTTEYYVSEVEVDSEYRDYAVDDAEDALANGEGTRRRVSCETTWVDVDPIKDV